MDATRIINSRNTTNETTFDLILTLDEMDEIVKAEQVLYLVSTGSTSWAHPTYSQGESFDTFDQAEEYFYQLIREEKELLEDFDENNIPNSSELEKLLDKDGNGKFEIPYVAKYDKASNIEYKNTVIISKATAECSLVDTPELQGNCETSLVLVTSGRDQEMVGRFGLQMVSEDDQVSFCDLDGEVYQVSGFSWTIPSKVPLVIAEYAKSVCN